MIERLRRRQEWILFGALFRAAPVAVSGLVGRPRRAWRAAAR